MRRIATREERTEGRESIVPRQRDTLIAIHHGLLLFFYHFLSLFHAHSASNFVTRHWIINLSLRLLASHAPFMVSGSIDFFPQSFKKIKRLEPRSQRVTFREISWNFCWNSIPFHFTSKSISWRYFLKYSSCSLMHREHDFFPFSFFFSSNSLIWILLRIYIFLYKLFYLMKFSYKLWLHIIC